MAGAQAQQRQTESRSYVWEGEKDRAVSDAPYRNLDTYRKFVAAVATSTKQFGSKVLVTRSDDNVSVVVAKVFSQSNKRVCILTRALKLPVYGSDEVVAAAKQFLTDNPDAEICILLQQEAAADHPLLRAMAQFNGRFHIQSIPEELRAKYQYRFVVGDAKHYRFIERCDATEGYVKFGDPEGGKRLEQAFDTIWDRIQRPA